MKGVLEWVHALVILGVASIAFVPLAYAKYVLPVPPLLYLLWLVFGGCPLSAQAATGGGRDFFIHTQLSKLVAGITTDQVNHIIGIVLTAGPVALCYRALRAQKADHPTEHTGSL